MVCETLTFINLNSNTFMYIGKKKKKKKKVIRLTFTLFCFSALNSMIHGDPNTQVILCRKPKVQSSKLTLKLWSFSVALLNFYLANSTS